MKINLSNNYITSLHGIETLKQLKVLNLSYNLIKSLKNIPASNKVIIDIFLLLF
jgi:Leucine-rich repeat (LRR) protein